MSTHTIVRDCELKQEDRADLRYLIKRSPVVRGLTSVLRYIITVSCSYWANLTILLKD